MEIIKVRGVVGPGKTVGRRLGYPTANIYGLESVEVDNGVYAVEAAVEGREGVLYGMANFGYRPTIEGGSAPRVLEIHLFDFTGDLYGRELEIRFCKYIRPEMQFAGTEALADQLRKDEATVREYFESKWK